jgi:hypothetical protein
MNKLYTLFIVLFLFANYQVNAQGCVAIRSFSGMNNALGQTGTFDKGTMNIGLNYRYFKSFRHFRGTEEEPDRIANNTEVINWTNNVDLVISYAITDRIYAVATLPYAHNKRSSLYEHGRTERYNTYSKGIADSRLGLGYWLFPQAEKGNMAIGLGAKLPTGNYAAEDFFHNVGPDGAGEIRPVDQSIQLGDGGFGIILDFQGFWALGNRFSMYYDGFYLINPRETNGTRTFRETLNPILANESIMAVPDQYAFRAGMASHLPIHGLGISLGARWEGVPVRDLIGGNEGFRRPGYVVSVDPGIFYMKGDFGMNVNLPVALIRNRTRSVTDIQASEQSGNFRHGDAAFADYLLSVSVNWRIGKKKDVAPNFQPFE